MYVDEILFIGDDTTERERMKKVLTIEFEIKDLGPMENFLGMEVTRSKKGIYVSQRKYIIDLMRETGCLESKPTAISIEENHKLRYKKGEVPVDKGRYQRLVGRLIICLIHDLILLMPSVWSTNLCMSLMRNI